MTNDAAVRLIKKYPNRRLYDTQNSVYITLAEVKDMVLHYENIKVIDLKTQEDVTRSILLQIILEEESGGMPFFSADLLAQLIRFYGHAMQNMMGQFLETNFKSFVDMQHVVQEKARLLCGDDQSKQASFWTQFINFQGPALQTMASTYMEQSQQVYQQMQQNIKLHTEKLLAGISVSKDKKNPIGTINTRTGDTDPNTNADSVTDPAANSADYNKPKSKATE